jgi:hypothetical protein
MTVQKDIIDKYILLLMEYIHLIHGSEIIKGLENPQAVFQIGFNALVHIYKITFLITKNVESAGCYTQKGMYCYLEYIEQMNRTNTLHNLDNMDAILFVYDKTLTDVYVPTGLSSDVSHQQNMFINILSLNHPHSDVVNYRIVLENLAYMSRILLWFDRADITNLQRIDLAHETLYKWMTLYLASGTVDATRTAAAAEDDGFKTKYTNPTLALLKYVAFFQENTEMSYTEYVGLLETFYKTQKKMAKQRKLPAEDLIQDRCLTMSIAFSGRPFRDLIKSEFAKSEAWKTDADFIKWLFV